MKTIDSLIQWAALMFLVLGSAFFVARLASAAFSGVEYINHTGGSVLIRATCFYGGASEITGATGDGEYNTINLRCPKEGEME
jgi:hypothetical protein